MSEMLVIVPMFGRAHRAVPLAVAFQRASTVSTRVMFVCSPDDHDVIDACRAAEADTVVAPFAQGPGDWAKKVNLAYRVTDEPFMLLGASDLDPQHGWDERALFAAEKSLAGVIGTNDMGNPTVKRGLHSTHPVVRRSYADLWGTIDGIGVVDEGYFHNYVDTELVETAKHRRQWAFAARSIVVHLHPFWHKGEDDEVYELGREHYHEDHFRFEQRRPLWGGPPPRRSRPPTTPLRFPGRARRR